MRQLLALFAVLALLGGCSDLNPFADDTAAVTDADKDKKAADADKKPDTPKRVVIARLTDELKPDPEKLDSLAPASRPDDTNTAADPEADPDADRTPAADQEFVDYLKGKPAKKSAPRRAPRPATRSVRPSSKPRALVPGADIDPRSLSKITPGAGPGRKTGNVDDAYSADRDFINVLMTDTKPARRVHHVRKRTRVTVRPTPRKHTARKPVRTIRVARRTERPARTAARRTPPKRTPPKRTSRTRTAPRRTGAALATLDGAEAADREVLKILGGK